MYVSPVNNICAIVAPEIGHMFERQESFQARRRGHQGQYMT